MYSLLLVDDEPAVLNSLLNAIPWKEYGFEQISTATDGKKALQLMEETTFDLLITDIRMPNMDGLELLRNVSHYHLQTRFVILTAYDEFEYAVEALHLGAENYLLKPINPVELSATVEKALYNLGDLQKNLNKLVSYDNIFNENLLSRWTSGDLTGFELSERANIAGVNVLSRSYCVMLVVGLSDDALSKMAEKQMVESLTVSYDCYRFTDSNGSRVFISGGADVNPQQLKSIIQPLLDQLDHPALFTAIGVKASGSEDVPVSYKSANDIIRFRMLFSRNSVVVSEEVQRPGYSSFSLNYIEFCRLLREGSEDDIQSATQRLMQQILGQTKDSIHAAKAQIIELLLHVARETEKYLLPGEELPSSLQNLFSHLDLINTDTDLLEWVCQVMTDASSMIQIKTQNNSPIINRALKYINENYDQPLSIKLLSDNMGVNPSYLGYLFKSEVGMYFSDYLNQIRLQSSEKLILETNMTIQEIASKVGYSEPSYFIRVFNKTYGLSPARYRQIGEKDDL